MSRLFPETTKQSHFEKTSFRVAKKIYAPLDIKNNIVCIKLSLIYQDVFSAFDKTIIYPVPNKWCSYQEWTYINLQKVRKDMFENALKTDYPHVAPKKIALLIKQDSKINNCGGM